MAAILSNPTTVLTRPAPCPQHARFTAQHRLAVVAQARSEGSHASIAAKAGSLVALGAALMVSASPALAIDDSQYNEQQAKDSAIRQTQDSGKASPPPAPSAANTPGGGAPKLQSPVRDIIGKVTGGSDAGAPGAGTPAAPNTTR